MKENPYHQDKEDMRELVKQFQNLKAGRSHSFLDEEAFEKIIDYFDDVEDFTQALEAAELGAEQFPYSSTLLIKKADLLIATRQYQEALKILNHAELLDSNDINLYITIYNIKEGIIGYLVIKNRLQLRSYDTFQAT